MGRCAGGALHKVFLVSGFALSGAAGYGGHRFCFLVIGGWI